MRVIRFCRGVEQACRAPLNKALCSARRISLETSSDVPAQLWSVITSCSGFASIQSPLFCNQCVCMARGLSREPSLDIFFISLCSIFVPSLFESGELLAQLKTMMQLHWLWRWLLHNFLSGLFTDPFLSGVTGLFLHVRSIPQQNSQWQFWACVLLTTVRQDAVSPSGNIPL